MIESERCVFVASGEIQAHQIRTFLESAGITSFFRGESLRQTHGLTIDGLGRVEVLVAAEDEERATALLASAEAGDFRLGEDASLPNEP